MTKGTNIWCYTRDNYCLVLSLPWVDVGAEGHESESIWVLVHVLWLPPLIATLAGGWGWRTVVQLSDGHAVTAHVCVHGACHAHAYPTLPPTSRVLRPRPACLASYRKRKHSVRRCWVARRGEGVTVLRVSVCDSPLL